MNLPPWDPVKESSIVPDAEFLQMIHRLKQEMASGHFVASYQVKTKPVRPHLERRFRKEKDGTVSGPYYYTCWRIHGRRIRRYIGSDALEAATKLKAFELASEVAIENLSTANKAEPKT